RCARRRSDAAQGQSMPRAPLRPDRTSYDLRMTARYRFGHDHSRAMRSVRTAHPRGVRLAAMELRDRWNHLLPDAKPLGQDLLGRYAEPHRAYHDQRHLTEMLDTIDELAGEAADPDSVRLAA